jgi:hypothetical protein
MRDHGRYCRQLVIAFWRGEAITVWA